MHHICFHVRKWKNPGERKQGANHYIVHAASLTHSLQCGGFQSCTCADGHWLVGENSGCLFLKIEKKKTPSEWVVIHVYRYSDPTTQVVPGLGPGPCLAPEPFSMSSPTPCVSLALAVSYCQAHFWKPHQWSAFFLLPYGTISFQVAGAFSAVCLSVQNQFFPSAPDIPLSSSWQWAPSPLTPMQAESPWPSPLLKGVRGFMSYIVNFICIVNFPSFYVIIKALLSLPIKLHLSLGPHRVYLTVERGGAARD